MPPGKQQGKRCTVHRPTIEQLSQTTFSEYIRRVVFAAATAADDEPVVRLNEGIAKITFPQNYFTTKYQNDVTGRRSNVWDEVSTELNFTLETPIQQNLRGLAGVYEYNHRGLNPMRLLQFRTQADEYAQAQLGKDLWEKTTDLTIDEETIQLMERRFWKRLTPTMPPAIYGADQEGTLFVKDANNPFAISNLDSCLNLLADSIPGVTTPYLYAGMFATVFCAHTEDMNLLSINYLHAGAPKLWYAVPEPHAQRFQSLAEHYYAGERNQCKEFLRHKRNLLSPAVLNKAGIPYVTAIQYPGDAIVTFPGSYHFGFNIGYNVAEATNFAVPEWIPFGEAAKVCMCRPDSVRIHMGRLKELLQIYTYDTVTQEMSYTEWRRKFQEEAKVLLAGDTNGGKRIGMTIDATTTTTGIDKDDDGALAPERIPSAETSLPVVEVSSTALSSFPVSTLPVSIIQSAAGSLSTQIPGDTTVPMISSTSTVPMPPTKETTTTEATQSTTRPKKKKRKQPLSEQQRKKEFWVELTGRPEDWRLAVPIQKTNKSKCLSVQRRILLFVSPHDELAVFNQQEETCFAGRVVELADGHVRLHLDGQTRANDVWIPLNERAKQRVFLDGGAWKQENVTMPALHYWVEQDSSRLRNDNGS